ncbi:SigE family RNA polymerase sigma factor [Thermomonospora umbrina]|uniref:RNA polymerase sigma-70 factor (Sigma-E family) n=1 Tax=Thermomonospora umbrina TaxID=111806 RepID=A0A3D9T0B6_9ACTN|nr:SigE family RNA polymerase sigma factor [Thermomonospora umbrina]REE98705.1 RNA polymerase sigma-70 factor (sigma-E family) [Thermomonospora umbrina]
MRETDERRYTEYVTGALPSLRRLAHLLCKDPHRADDVVQNTITRLYVHWQRAQAADDIDRYVRAMLVRVFLREQRLAWARVRLTGDAPEPARHVESPGTDVETRAVLHTALTRVPPRQRAVLVLRFLCDMPVSEVAATLGCSEGTVKSQTSQGLGRLRALLDPQMFETLGRR